MTEVHKVSVALTTEQLDALTAAVDKGEYATISEVVGDAIQDWRRKREPRQSEVLRLRRLWDEGKASGPPELLDIERTIAAAKARLSKFGAA